MNPHQKNKINVSSLSPEEQRLFRLYGKLPSKSDHFAKHLKERKYFDSGDYAMSKAGKGDSVDTATVGSQHPVPENIPHLSSPVNGTNSAANGANGANGGAHPNGPTCSPIREGVSGFLQCGRSPEEKICLMKQTHTQSKMQQGQWKPEEGESPEGTEQKESDHQMAAENMNGSTGKKFPLAAAMVTTAPEAVEASGKTANAETRA